MAGESRGSKIEVGMVQNRREDGEKKKVLRTNGAGFKETKGPVKRGEEQRLPLRKKHLGGYGVKERQWDVGGRERLACA